MSLVLAHAFGVRPDAAAMIAVTLAHTVHAIEGDGISVPGAEVEFEADTVAGRGPVRLQNLEADRDLEVALDGELRHQAHGGRLRLPRRDHDAQPVQLGLAVF